MGINCFKTPLSWKFTFKTYCEKENLKTIKGKKVKDTNSDSEQCFPNGGESRSSVNRIEKAYSSGKPYANWHFQQWHTW